MMLPSATLDVSVIIANYNGERWLRGCLDSLREQMGSLTYEVIVVDNASQDDSVRLLHEMFPWVKIIVNDNNLGFARANNQAIVVSKGRYVLMLNNDTVFLHGLESLAAFLESHPDCAAVGPRMLNGQRRPRGSWGYFPTLSRLTFTMLLIDRLPLIRRYLRPLIVRPNHPEFHQLPRPVDWASGACLLIRREAFEKSGLLDEHYFMYGEDTEWCYRIQQAGYQVWVLPMAEVVHYGAGGGEWHNWKGPQATMQAYRSFLYFHRKHSPPWVQIPLRLGLIVGTLLRMLGGIILLLRELRDDRKRAFQVLHTYHKVLHDVLLRGNSDGRISPLRT